VVDFSPDEVARILCGCRGGPAALFVLDGRLMNASDLGERISTASGLMVFPKPGTVCLN
jgi:hypothetical protein